ncbi:transcription-associated protein 1 [Batrachochytrium dendrobatidis]
MTLNASNCEVFANRLNDPNILNNVKVAIVTELRDSIEIVQSGEYPRFLAHILPVFINLLEKTPSAFSSDHDNHKLRNIILEIIHRFPHNEALRQYVLDLMRVLMIVLREDNEDNGSISLKIIVDLHKNYKMLAEEFVQPFLNIVQEMYQNMEKAVTDAFGDINAMDEADQSVASSSPGLASQKTICLSMFSFKVLTECPIIIALLFQIHRKFVTPNVPQFVPYIVKVLMLQPYQQQQAHQNAEANGTIFLGMSPDIKDAALYVEFKSLQVKTVSFIAYILRSFISLLKPYEDSVANGVICLMKDCPPDASATRKELLIATRHLFFTEFRKAFVPHMDVILNDDVLVGTGVTCRETLRPLGHSVLVDLIHHVRNELTLDQITKVIYVYSKNLHDPSFQPQIQTMCAKLLLSLIDNVVNQQSKSDARRLVLRTLDTFASRLKSINDMHSTVIRFLKRKTTSQNSTTEENFSHLLEMDGFLDIGYVQPIRTCARPLDGAPDLIKDIRLQIKSVLLGIKTALFALRSLPASTAETSDVHLIHSYSDEVAIFIHIFKEGLDCFKYFSSDIETTETVATTATSANLPTTPGTNPDQSGLSTVGENSATMTTASKEDKEVYEAFASIFTFVDPPIFQEVFSTNMQLLFDQAVKSSSLLAVPQYFLANLSVSANFSGLLLSFLVDRLPDLGFGDASSTYAMLRLFKLLFMAVTLFPESNESILCPHLANIIMSCLRLSAKAKNPINYFLLLRSLFRSIGGGRFELLYQEVLPLLQVLLETLNALLVSAHQPQTKELFVELCLTVPVRLSVLLPYLSYLMRPLVIALQAGPELVSQSLRTLELCVDNLSHEFLEPILNPVIDELMTALWKHLQPSPYNQLHSHTTLRILGKFGGRNRRWLKDRSALEFLARTDSALSVNLLFNGGMPHPQYLCLDEILVVAKRLVNLADTPQRLHYQAFRFAKGCLPLLIEFDDSEDSILSAMQDHLKRFFCRHSQPVLENTKSTNVATSPLPASQKKSQLASPFANLNDSISCRHKSSIDESLTGVLLVIFACAATDELHDEAWRLLQHLCRHFAMLSIGEAGIYREDTPSDRIRSYSFDFLDVHSLSKLNGFIEALVETLSSDSSKQRDIAERALIYFYEIILLWVETKDCVDTIPALHIFASRFCSNCYQFEWLKKTGGCLGISIMASKLQMGPKWMLEHELEFVKALLYVLKDVAADVAYFNLEDTTQTLSYVLKVCNTPSEQVSETERTLKFNSLVSLLTSELSNANSAVRESIRASFQLLSTLTETELSDMIRPVCERLMPFIFAKPLRALPFAIQIGHIDAVTYCLSLRPPLLTFHDELLRLLHEALALADAEDQALVSKASQFKNAVSLNNLRVVCIRLLSAAMACADFASPRHHLIRPRIISVFFKSLYSKSNDVVEAANKGLQQVVAQQHKLPKDLLQAGLRPILVNLADHKRLTVSGLEGLAKLLELLTNYFKVEIGKKLLDHLRLWAEPKVLEEISGRPIGDVEEIKVIVAILDIFHRLPSSASIFMDDIIKNVLFLEQRVHRSISSPFRKPLIRYLNKYPTEATTYFLQKISLPRETALFLGMLASEESTQLRAAVSSAKEYLLTKVFDLNEVDSTVMYRNGIHLVKHLVAYDAQWLVENFEVVDRIREIWRGGFLSALDEYVYIRGREHTAFFELLIEYSKFYPLNVDIIFDIVEGFIDPEIVDYGFLRKFVYEEVGKTTDFDKRSSIFKRYLELFPLQEVSTQRKICMMRYLITPMLLLGTEHDAHIVDTEVVESILANVWAPLIADSSCSSVDLDSLKIELLQLTNLLVHRVPEVISESRKDVIKFAWNHLKVEDVTLKQSAYVLLSRFIREYETPVKIVSQIYVALLRAHQAEGRILVKQALDTLLPVLPIRLASSTGERARMPLFVQWIRKVVVEEGHIVTQLLSLYQLLIRNADQFYLTREHFLPQIVSSLAKLGLSGSATMETRTLTLDLGDLIIVWEKRELEEANANGNADAHDEGMDWTSAQDSHDVSSPATALTLDYKEMIVSYLLRFVLSLSEPQTSKPLIQRAIDLFKTLITLSPDVPIKLSQTEKAITYEEDSSSVVVSNAIDMLMITVNTKPAKWVHQNLSTLQRCIEKWIQNDQPSLVVAISSILMSMWNSIDDNGDPEQPSADEALFYKMLDATVQHGLGSLTNIYAAVSILEASCLHRLDKPSAQSLLRSHVIELTKLFGVLIKDVNSTHPTVITNGSVTDILKTIIQLLNAQITQLGELRKAFFAGIMAIIDLQDTPELHVLILSILRQWIFVSHHDAFPTMKERASVAVKMLSLYKSERSPIANDYMTLVADIYEDPEFARTELTVRLETAFLEGTLSPNHEMRERILRILDCSLQPTLQLRLDYVLSVQNWEPLASSFWIRHAVDILLGSVDSERRVQTHLPLQRICCISGLKTRHQNLFKTEDVSMDVDGEHQVSAEINQLLAAHIVVSKEIGLLKLSSLMEPIKAFIQEDVNLSSWLWIAVFPMCWAQLTSRERHDAIKGFINLLARDFHTAQASMRPNVIQTMLQGICKCKPPVQLPPHLVRHLGKTYNAWHVALELLQNAIIEPRSGIVIQNKEEEKIKESVMDSLADIYASLSEDDYFYGLWRRKALFNETNAAVSYEQCGMWATAQTFYESAQLKARTGVLPFTELEYCLWESHWIECAERLQQWDILTDLAKHDSNPDLLLECMWRLSDWNTDKENLALSLQSCSEPATARKKMFQAFLVLQNRQDDPENQGEFQRLCNEGMQLVLRRWTSLPSIVSNSHIGTFHAFQQFVELQEAGHIQNNLVSTNTTNIDSKSQELKGILQTWRERLPNRWDDITLWSDLLAWRQHVFTSINNAYIPLIPQMSQPLSNGNPTSSYTFRGYHETAWIINRFAHVARKHQLPEVCINSLSKIYTLPNIEIQEAFFKLREQAKCHLKALSEYSTGLDVINNTNLLYFTVGQKAEFFTLKGQFLFKLNLHEDAVQAFSSAVNMDLSYPKAWASWGKYNDSMMNDFPQKLEYGVGAVNCYLHAASLYNNGRSRKFLARILWLLSLDDDQGTLAKSYDGYKPDVPVWYWITFVPQLILSLSGKESIFARQILLKIAKAFPQSLHFQLRTAKEDFLAVKRPTQSATTSNSAAAQTPAPTAQTPKTIPTIEVSSATSVEDISNDNEISSTDAVGDDLIAKVSTSEHPVNESTDSSKVPVSSTPTKDKNAAATPAVSTATPAPAVQPAVKRQPWEIIDEIMGLLKTAFPLLALSMETMVDQILLRLKPTTDEDIYRLIVALLSDGVQMYLQQLTRDPNDGGNLSPATANNLVKFGESMQPNHLKYKDLFEKDFIASKPNLSQLVSGFRTWRDNLEKILDCRPRVQYLEHFSHHLVEFEYQKFDEIEVPGQYFEMRPNNKDFVHIERFSPTIDVTRGHICCYKSLTILGHDGSSHRFTVQNPAARHCRREERILQLFRILNDVMARKKEARKRNLNFHLPILVPLAPQIRLVEDDRSDISLQDVYESHCVKSGIHKDDPIIFYAQRIRQIFASVDITRKAKVEILNLKTEIMEEIGNKLIPETIMTEYFQERMMSYIDLWTFRKRFTSHLATMTFMTYLMSIGHRYPQKIFMSPKTGGVWSSDLLPTISNSTTLFTNNEAVPFRFTPNIQHFLTPIGVEGVFVASLMAVGRSLTKPEFELADYLSIFIRDELVTWQSNLRKNAFQPTQLRELVNNNVNVVVKRAQSLACKAEREKSAQNSGDRAEPVCRTILDLISHAVNPLKLAQMDIAFMPQL